MGVINQNPVAAVIPPKHFPKEIQVLDSNQIQTLLIFANDQQPEYHALYQLAITTGMRLGEILGLKWKDINWRRKSLSISRQLQRIPGKGYEFSTPKSKSGIRTIILGTYTINLLKAHQKNDLKRLGNKYLENGFSNLVFVDDKDTPLGHAKIQRAFKQLLEIGGLPNIRFHDLRHSAATLMLTNGVDILIVSKRLGHSKSSITLDIYGHAVPGLQKKQLLSWMKLQLP